MNGSGVGAVERAFQLARDGQCQTIEDIRRQLHREKHQGIRIHLSGALIKKQLSDILTAQS